MSLKSKTLGNIGWMTSLRILSYILRVATYIIFALYFSQTSYGIISFALIVIDLSILLGDFQISTALIQRKNTTLAEIHTGATVRFILAIIAMIILIVTGPYIASVMINDTYAAVEAGKVIQVLSILFILNNAGFVPHIILTKELDFKRITIAIGIGAIVTSIMEIILVILQFQYWGIVIGLIVGAAVTAATYFFITPHKIAIRFTINRDHLRSILSFCIYLVPIPFFVYAAFHIDKYLLTFYFSPFILGIYMVAWTWGTFMAFNLVEILNNVLFPTYSKMEDKRKMKNGYLLTCRYIGYILFPLSFVLIGTADEFVTFLLGGGTPKWISATVPLQFFTLFGLVYGLFAHSGSIWIALGHVRINLIQTTVISVLQIAGAVIAVIFFKSIDILAFFYFLTIIPWAIWVLLLITSVIPVKLSEILKEYLYSAIAGLTIFPYIIFVRVLMGFSWSSFIIQAFGGLAIFIIMMVLLTKKQFIDDMRLVIQKIKRKI